MLTSQYRREFCWDELSGVTLQSSLKGIDDGAGAHRIRCSQQRHSTFGKERHRLPLLSRATGRYNGARLSAIQYYVRRRVRVVVAAVHVLLSFPPQVREEMHEQKPDAYRKASEENSSVQSDQQKLQTQGRRGTSHATRNDKTRRQTPATDQMASTGTAKTLQNLASPRTP